MLSFTLAHTSDHVLLFCLNAGLCRRKQGASMANDMHFRSLPSPTNYSSSKPTVLNSWKEIAKYMDRGVRTVQRWEGTLRLPIHRIGLQRGVVFAYSAEIDAWLYAFARGPIVDYSQLKQGQKV